MSALRPRATLRQLRLAAPLLLLAALVAAAALGTARAEAATAPKTTVVPDLRKQAYVFAKATLLDGGFAWRVEGATQGYPANLVVAQTPAPGTRVVIDAGAPTILLRLAPNPRSAEAGSPEAGSPYSGTEALTPAQAAALARRQARAAEQAAAKAARAAKAAKPAPIAAKPAATRTFYRAADVVAPPVQAAAAPAKKAAVKRPAIKRPAVKKPTPARKPAPPAARPVAFTVPGAPVEPVRELPLPARARLLAAWAAKAPAYTAQTRHHFLYQHAWVVTGARFGWSQGARALRTLVAADTQLARHWPTARFQLREARAALAEVEQRTAAAARTAATARSGRSAASARP